MSTEPADAAAAAMQRTLAATQVDPEAHIPAWRRQAERSNVYMLRFMRWFAQWAPGWLASALIWCIATYYMFHPARETILASRQYLARALEHPPGWWDTHFHFRVFAHFILERVLLISRGASGFDLRPTGEKIIARHHAAGTGAVLLGAHLGSFECLRAFGRELPGLSVRHMMYPDNAEVTTQLLDELDPELAAQVIPLSDGRTAMLAACESLEMGHFVAFLGDRMPRGDMRNQIEATFFGAPLRLPTSPYLAAMIAGVPLILCFAPRLGRLRYEIVFEEIYDGRPVPRAQRADKCAELAQIYANRMETLCRRHPYNWFNFYDVWS